MVYLFLLGRVLLGVYFLMSGFNHLKNLKMLTGYAQSKGVPMPMVATFVTGLMMLFGGAGILFGFLTNLSICLLAVFLLVTTLEMHQYWKVTDPMQKMGEHINFWKNMGLLGALLMLLAIPIPWAMSLF